MGSVVRGVRASEEEWARWVVAAGGRSLNGWLRLLANAAAEAVEAEERRRLDVVLERERLKGLMRG